MNICIFTISQQIQTIAICSCEKLSHIHLGENRRCTVKSTLYNEFERQIKHRKEQGGGEGHIFFEKLCNPSNCRESFAFYSESLQSPHRQHCLKF
jgi:hypothetical protein